MPMLRSVSWNRISRSNDLRAERDHAEGEEAGEHGEDRRDRVHRTVDGGRCDALLEEQLDAVGQGDQHATGPRRASGRRVSACRRSPCAPSRCRASRRSARRRTRSRPARRGSSSRPSPSTVASCHGRRGPRGNVRSDGHGRLLRGAALHRRDARASEHLPGQQRVRRGAPADGTARTPRRPRHAR